MYSSTSSTVEAQWVEYLTGVTKIVGSNPAYDYGTVMDGTGWHSRLMHSLGARGPEFDSQISHPCFDFFPFCVA